jgi:hypothetical protein
MTNVEFTTPDVGSNRASIRRRSRYVSKPLSKDNRRGSVKRYDRIVSGLVTALGSDLAIEHRILIEAFAGTWLKVQDFNSRLLLGEEVDLQKHATAITTLVQLAQFIGVIRHEVDKDAALGDALLRVAVTTKGLEA